MDSRGRYVLSGGMNSGKTEIIHELVKRGNNTVCEAAMEIVAELQSDLGSIKEQQSFLQNDFESGKPSVFHQKNIELQLANESGIELDEITFLDRGIWDYQAFCLLRNLPITEDMEFLFKHRGRYDKVFISDSLPVFETREGSGRIIDEELARKMTGLCRKVYEESSHKIIETPIFKSDGKTLLSVGERTDFILEHV